MIRSCLVALLAAAALGGCGSKPSDPVAECRAQVYQDPTVQQMIRVQAANLRLKMAEQPALDEAKRQALLACLRARGLAPPGGVEAPRPPTATFRGLF